MPGRTPLIIQVVGPLSLILDHWGKKLRARKAVFTRRMAEKCALRVEDATFTFQFFQQKIKERKTDKLKKSLDFYDDDLFPLPGNPFQG